MFSLICVWINGWVNTRDTGDLGRHRAHYEVTVMYADISNMECIMTSSNGKNFRVTGPLWWNTPVKVGFTSQSACNTPLISLCCESELTVETNTRLTCHSRRLNSHMKSLKWTSTLAWINKHKNKKEWDETICPFPNFIGATVEGWELIIDK